MKTSVKWNYGEPNPNQKDAVWSYGINLIAEVSLETEDGKKYSLDIFCDGETRVHAPYKNDDGTYSDDYEVIRYADQWEARGIKTDAEMQKFSEEMLELGHDIWVHNSWFDLYTEIDGVSEHLDAVTHDIDDAVSQAEAILKEVVSAGGWKEYFQTLYV
jgi:hypothetical protein